MKINVEVDCTPDEARRFLGLPDLSKVNEVYVDSLTKAMTGLGQGTGSIDQLQEMMGRMAPMGQMGLKMFEQFMGASLDAAGKPKKG